MKRLDKSHRGIDWKTFFINQLLFPIHERLKNHQTLAVHKSLMNTQWMSSEQLRFLQAHKLRHFLMNITEHVPYYQTHHGTFPLDMAIDELSTWPFLTKALIRENKQKLIHSKARSLQSRSTGGSTGEPLQFYLSKKRISVDVAQKWRATRWWGVDIGDPEFVLWGSAIESKAQSTLKTWRDRCLRTEFHSAHPLDLKRALALLERIQILKPKMLFAYPSLLAYLAQTAIENGIEVPESIKVAFVTSEMLEPFQRELIEQAFDCRVANGYGGRESGFIAHECPSGSMHISAEDLIVEIIDSNGQKLPENEVGEIVVTHLATKEFPFVRYRTGDLASLSYKPCPCGRGLPVLNHLQGRMSDLLHNHKGEVIHRSQIIQSLSEYNQILQFRFEQMTYEHYKLFYTGHLDSSSKALLETKLKTLIGSESRLDWVGCDTLPLDLSGKHRFIVSHVSSKIRQQELKSA